MVLLRSIATVGGFTLISRVLGFLRDILIAAVLGAGAGADVFFVAFKLPNLFRRLFAEGAFSMAFVPMFAGRVEAEGQARATVSGADGAVIDAARLTVEGANVAASGGVRAEVLGGGARVRAPRVTIREGGAFTASGGADVELSGRAQATVRARTVSGGGGRYEAVGGVRVVSSGGRTLVAERVIWSESAGRFSAPGTFSFDGPGERVRGVGLSATADLSRYSFRNATGEIEVSE